MDPFLLETEATSREFSASGSRLVGTIILTAHAGGTWKLQAQAPDETWVDTNITFTDDDIYSDLAFEQNLKYRLTGGTTGAKAWISRFA